MISKLHIENFKGWENTGNINLAPLTILFGSNSSGKSSIGQFIMLLKQSVSLSDPTAVLFPGNRDSAVDLGLPSDMIYKQDLTRTLSFSYTWSLDNSLIFVDYAKADHSKNYVCTKVEFECNIRIKDRITQGMEVESFIYRLYNDHTYLFSIGMEKSESKNETKNDLKYVKRSYKIVVENFEALRSPGRVWDITPPIKYFGFPEEAIAYYQNIGFVRNLNTLQTKLFSNVFYLGPLRIKADRLYSWTGTTPINVGDDGRNTIAAILAAKAQQRFYNFKNKGKKMPFDAVIAMMLKKMNLIEDFKVNKIAEERQEYEVKVRTKGSEIWTDIPDVGFGVSQVLPVLVQLFYAPPGSVIIMEQPELHLHPSAQAGLADVLIYALKARENAHERNIQLVIETHSEHFLRRLQRRVAELDSDSNISSDMVSAYFVNNSHSPTLLESLQLDRFGNIINWPEDFFGDLDGDIRAQSMASYERRINEQKKFKDN